MLNVVISKEPLKSVQSSRLAWQNHIDKMKEEKIKKEKGQKRKQMEDELSSFKKKKKMVQEDIEKMNKDYEKCFQKGENDRNWFYITLASKHKKAFQIKRTSWLL